MTRQDLLARARECAPDVLRALGRAMVMGCGVLAAACFVLWDVDLNDARGRYERAMLALFGTWDAVRGIAVAETGTHFETRMVDGLSFVSGFDRSRDPPHRWCYLSDARDGKAARVVTLGEVEAQGKVRWHVVSEADAAVFGLVPARLMAAALRGCVFN